MWQFLLMFPFLLAQTYHAEASARHSGWWILETLAPALIGGAAIAFEGYY